MKRERKITKKDIKEIAKKYDLDPIDIQDIVEDMESDGIRVTREDIEDMYLNGDLLYLLGISGAGIDADSQVEKPMRLQVKE